MDVWQIVEWAAWILSAALCGWMLLDFVKTDRSYSEEQLLSSREGVDDLFGDARKGS
ncbi:MAG TPA: hypothetical protein VHA10_18055 [Hypericibacter adhaerens]|jgi:hypothetical protein|uniref:Uncharacterized protein n=1 Tax=Hypericibacter adhaerens TaxID=2602016 RepID=A0A5J6N7M7_9PROT|nr:hypothetical protein [Hypericibacter adhaerens]QEX24873.1 hypothetical protein FRZ61_48150 [Hypericibacter adhaerens]HWA45130.1 hypothetical protein [Hypericibacter adhaerens]